MFMAVYKVSVSRGAAPDVRPVGRHKLLRGWRARMWLPEMRVPMCLCETLAGTAPPTMEAYHWCEAPDDGAGAAVWMVACYVAGRPKCVDLAASAI